MSGTRATQRTTIFGVANILIAAFNCTHLLTACLSGVMISLDLGHGYRTPQGWPLVVFFVVGYFFMSLIGVLLPLGAGIGLLRRSKVGYWLHLLAAIPGGLLFFPPFGLAYPVFAYTWGRGAEIKAEEVQAYALRP